MVYEVTLVDDFDQTEQILKAGDFRLVLLDVTLPGRDGYEICRNIRSFSGIPIIFLTSRDTDMDELYGMTMGGDDFVRKPYNMPILLARIAALPSAQRPQYRTGDQDRLGGVLPDAFQRKAVPWESGSDSDASGDAAAGLSFLTSAGNHSTCGPDRRALG